MRKQVAIFSLCVCCMISTVASRSVAAEEEWHFEKEQDGIEVFTRAVSGSGIKEFKGIGVVSADVKRILAFLEDANGYVKWFPNCVDSKALPPGEGVTYRYSVSGTPWPISNRDMILRIETSHEARSGRALMRIEAAPEIYPVQKGLVRIQKAAGSWTLETIGATKTRVTFQMHLEPGGGLPEWLINSRVVGTPLATIASLRISLGAGQAESEADNDE